MVTEAGRVRRAWDAGRVTDTPDGREAAGAPSPRGTVYVHDLLDRAIFRMSDYRMCSGESHVTQGRAAHRQVTRCGS